MHTNTIQIFTLTARMAIITTMNDSVRTFIALPVPREVVRNIVRCQQELARESADTIRWTPEDQIHLTLQFLGNISLAELRELQDRLASQVGRGVPAEPPPRLNLIAQGLGAFPSLRRPRIIWVGLQGDITALKHLQSSIETATALKEEREFHPHLTIGRVREGRRPKLNLDPRQDHPFGQWQPRELLLIQSNLSPKGATHSVLARFPIEREFNATKA